MRLCDATFYLRLMWQCSLGESVKPGRTVLKVKAAGKNCVLASLMADKIESSVLELMFEEVSEGHGGCAFAELRDWHADWEFANRARLSLA